MVNDGEQEDQEVAQQEGGNDERSGHNPGAITTEMRLRHDIDVGNATDNDHWIADYAEEGSCTNKKHSCVIMLTTTWAKRHGALNVADGCRDDEEQEELDHRYLQT